MTTLPSASLRLRAVLVGLLFSGCGALAQTAVPTPVPTDDEVIQLDPFQVVTREDGSYAVPEAQTGTIIAVPREQIPFNTSVLTSDMIKDLGITNASDISEYVAGLSRSTNPTIADENGQPSLNFRIRGFINRPLYDGFQTGGRIFSPDNFGRVEVSKGPNAVLYGQAFAGGVVNFIPKAPRFTDHASLSAGFGTNAHRKASFDLGGPLQTDRLPGKLAFRLGGSLLSFEREQIFFESEVGSLSAALSWRPSPRVNLEFRSEYTKTDIVPSRTAAFVTTGSGPARVVDPFNRLRNDRNFSYNGPYSTTKTDNYLSTAHVTFNLTDSVLLRVGGFASEQWQENLLLSGPFGLGTAQRVTNGRYVFDDNYRKTTAAKADLLWQARLGNWSIDSLLGYEAHWERGDLMSIRTPANIVVDIPFSRRPQAGDYQPPPPLSSFTELSNSQREFLQWTNVRFTQFLKSPEARATIMWGMARGDGDNRVRDLRLAQNAASEGAKTTYTVGATYRLLDGDRGALDQVILFANASTSFNIQGGNAQDPSKFLTFGTVAELTAFARSVAPNAIAPQEGEGFEVGFRTQWLDQKLNFTALYFDQTNKNIARNFFVRESNVAGNTSEVVIATFQLAGGQEASQGTELALDWRPTPQLTLTGSAQFTDGKVEKNPEAPEEVGFGLVQSPETMVSLLARYDFAAGSRLSGFSVGAGLSHNSPSRIRPEIGDRFRVSDTYTTVRALARYTFKSGGRSHTLAVNVENALNDEYTQEENFLSEPRLWRFSYRLDF